MLDTIASLILGGFLVTVAVKGKSADMVTLAKRDRAFLQWAIAVGVLYYLYGIPELHEAMGYIIALAFVGLFLGVYSKADSTFQSQVQMFWQSLGAN